jgi:hypothetical protein
VSTCGHEPTCLREAEASLRRRQANGAIRPEARTGLARWRWRERLRPTQDALRMLRAPRIEYWIQPVCISPADVLGINA